MVSDSDLSQVAQRVGEHLLASRRVLVTAESCTGGWIGKALTDVAGSSRWFAGGAIAYSNSLKAKLLSVDRAVIAQEGAVSESVARAMAEGALAEFDADIAIAVTGIAGPDGGTPDKPVGTVWFAWSRQRAGRRETSVDRKIFSGDREQVRRQTVMHALERVFSL